MSEYIYKTCKTSILEKTKHVGKNSGMCGKINEKKGIFKDVRLLLYVVLFHFIPLHII